jgi:Glycosyl hydrolases family 28
MHRKKILVILLFFFQTLIAYARDYPASLFGIKSDGVTLNTRSIQFGIDYINKKGGGRLVFYVGRYLTGSIHLNSNVIIHLEEGAVLVGSVNPFDYDKTIFTGLILATGQENIGITGKGVIDGQGRTLANNTIQNVHYGLVNDSLKYDRTQERPMIVYLRSCRNITIKNITLQNSAFWLQTYDQCKNLVVDSVTVNNKAFWNCDGIDIVDCDTVQISNCYIDAADDGICLKSHDDNAFCNNVLVKNNVIRSSASGIKLGTAGRGGFRNIKIINNTVFDTYRSAIALESVDGGFLEDVTVDGLKSIHTGNVIFLRLGERVAGRKSRMQRITIKNVIAEVPESKPDEGYEYEGPVEDMPRNISPVIIAGLPGQYISDIAFSNIEIKYPGRGNVLFANVPLDKLDSIPELPQKYPEFSMFKEVPAWGIYIRHAKNLNFSNIKLKVEKEDYRLSIVMDDVHNAQFNKLKIEQPGQKKIYHSYKSSDISVK